MPKIFDAVRVIASLERALIRIYLAVKKIYSRWISHSPTNAQKKRSSQLVQENVEKICLRYVKGRV